METAICSSITRAAGLGDGFWPANLGDVAAITASAMSSNQNQYPDQSSSSRSTPVVPPTRALSSATRAKSEQDCFKLLALEFASLPDRELAPEGSDTAAAHQQQQQLTAPTSTSNTPTNMLIAKTIRAAMADIKPRS
ncbi:hypothetical protein V8C37DRAFT_401800 [Trichoderma ceciliae]